MPEPVLTGACLCGQVRYALHAPLGASGYCHCTRCQRRTGTASSAGAFTVPGSFEVLAGQELIRTWWPKQGWGKAFCTACGGALYSQDPEAPENVAVRLGTIDGDPGVRPSYHQHVASAAVWEPLPEDGLPRYDGRRPATA